MKTKYRYIKIAEDLYDIVKEKGKSTTHVASVCKESSAQLIVSELNTSYVEK